MDENFELLFNELGLKEEFGDFESFSNEMQSPENRRLLFEGLELSNEFGDFDSFEKEIGFGAAPEPDGGFFDTVADGASALFEGAKSLLGFNEEGEEEEVDTLESKVKRRDQNRQFVADVEKGFEDLPPSMQNLVNNDFGLEIPSREDAAKAVKETIPEQNKDIANSALLEATESLSRFDELDDIARNDQIFFQKKNIKDGTEAAIDYLDEKYPEWSDLQFEIGRIADSITEREQNGRDASELRAKHAEKLKSFERIQNDDVYQSLAGLQESSSFIDEEDKRLNPERIEKSRLTKIRQELTDNEERDSEDSILGDIVKSATNLPRVADEIAGQISLGVVSLGAMLGEPFGNNISESFRQAALNVDADNAFVNALIPSDEKGGFNEERVVLRDGSIVIVEKGKPVGARDKDDFFIDLTEEKVNEAKELIKNGKVESNRSVKRGIRDTKGAITQLAGQLIGTKGIAGATRALGASASTAVNFGTKGGIFFSTLGGNYTEAIKSGDSDIEATTSTLAKGAATAAISSIGGIEKSLTAKGILPGSFFRELDKEIIRRHVAGNLAKTAIPATYKQLVASAIRETGKQGALEVLEEVTDQIVGNGIDSVISGESFDIPDLKELENIALPSFLLGAIGGAPTAFSDVKGEKDNLFFNSLLHSVRNPEQFKRAAAELRESQTANEGDLLEAESLVDYIKEELEATPVKEKDVFDFVAKSGQIRQLEKERDSTKNERVKAAKQREIDRVTEEISKLTETPEPNEESKTEEAEANQEAEGSAGEVPEGDSAPNETTENNEAQEEVQSQKLAFDFDGTLANGKELTELGADVKQRIESGEDITVVTARENTPENIQEISETLGISPDKIVATGDESKKGVELDRLGIDRNNFTDADQAKQDAIRGEANTEAIDSIIAETEADESARTQERVTSKSDVDLLQDSGKTTQELTQELQELSSKDDLTIEDINNSSFSSLSQQADIEETLENIEFRIGQFDKRQKRQQRAVKAKEQKIKDLSPRLGKEPISEENTAIIRENPERSRALIESTIEEEFPENNEENITKESKAISDIENRITRVMGVMDEIILDEAAGVSTNNKLVEFFDDNGVSTNGKRNAKRLKTIINDPNLFKGKVGKKIEQKLEEMLGVNFLKNLQNNLERHTKLQKENTPAKRKKRLAEAKKKDSDNRSAKEAARAERIAALNQILNEGTNESSTESAPEAVEIESAKNSGRKAKNKEELSIIFQEDFNLPKGEAEAAAAVADKMLETIAARDGITKEEAFGRVEFRKGDENAEDALRAGQVPDSRQATKAQRIDGAAKGAAVLQDGSAIVFALSDPNVSTPLHELAHVFEHYLTDSERKQIQDWAGTNGWTVETSEKFARGFEKFLADGKAPTPELQSVFEKFKDWLTDIYNGVTGSEIDLKLNDSMRDIYAKILSGEVDAETSTDSLVDSILADFESDSDGNNQILFQGGNPKLNDLLKDGRLVNVFSKAESEAKRNRLIDRIADVTGDSKSDVRAKLIERTKKEAAAEKESKNNDKKKEPNPKKQNTSNETKKEPERAKSKLDALIDSKVVSDYKKRLIASISDPSMKEYVESNISLKTVLTDKQVEELTNSVLDDVNNRISKGEDAAQVIDEAAALLIADMKDALDKPDLGAGWQLFALRKLAARANNLGNFEMAIKIEDIIGNIATNTGRRLRLLRTISDPDMIVYIMRKHLFGSDKKRLESKDYSGKAPIERLTEISSELSATDAEAAAVVNAMRQKLAKKKRSSAAPPITGNISLRDRAKKTLARYAKLAKKNFGINVKFQGDNNSQLETSMTLMEYAYYQSKGNISKAKEIYDLKKSSRDLESDEIIKSQGFFEARQKWDGEIANTILESLSKGVKRSKRSKDNSPLSIFADALREVRAVKNRKKKTRTKRTLEDDIRDKAVKIDELIRAKELAIVNTEKLNDAQRANIESEIDEAIRVLSGKAFNENKLRSAIKEGIKTQDQVVDEIVKDHLQNKDISQRVSGLEFKRTLEEKIILATGLPPSEVEDILSAYDKAFDEVMTDIIKERAEKVIRKQAIELLRAQGHQTEAEGQKLLKEIDSLISKASGKEKSRLEARKRTVERELEKAKKRTDRMVNRFPGIPKLLEATKSGLLNESELASKFKEVFGLSAIDPAHYRKLRDLLQKFDSKTFKADKEKVTNEIIRFLNEVQPVEKNIDNVIGFLQDYMYMNMLSSPSTPLLALFSNIDRFLGENVFKDVLNAVGKDTFNILKGNGNPSEVGILIDAFSEGMKGFLSVLPQTIETLKTGQTSQVIFDTDNKRLNNMRLSDRVIMKAIKDSKESLIKDKDPASLMRFLGSMFMGAQMTISRFLILSDVLFKGFAVPYYDYQITAQKLIAEGTKDPRAVFSQKVNNLRGFNDQLRAQVKMDADNAESDGLFTGTPKQKAKKRRRFERQRAHELHNDPNFRTEIDGANTATALAEELAMQGEVWGKFGILFNSIISKKTELSGSSSKGKKAAAVGLTVILPFARVVGIGLKAMHRSLPTSILQLQDMKDEFGNYSRLPLRYRKTKTRYQGFTAVEEIELTPYEMARNNFMATVPTMIAAGVAMMLLESGEDEDGRPTIKLDPNAGWRITGSGDLDSGLGKAKIGYQNLRENQNWEAYSIQKRNKDGSYTTIYKYKNNPMGIIWSILGNVSDGAIINSDKDGILSENNGSILSSDVMALGFEGMKSFSMEFGWLDPLEMIGDLAEAMKSGGSTTIEQEGDSYKARRLKSTALRPFIPGGSLATYLDRSYRWTSTKLGNPKFVKKGDQLIPDLIDENIIFNVLGNFTPDIGTYRTMLNTYGYPVHPDPIKGFGFRGGIVKSTANSFFFGDEEIPEEVKELTKFGVSASHIKPYWPQTGSNQRLFEFESNEKVVDVTNNIPITVMRDMSDEAAKNVGKLARRYLGNLQEVDNPKDMAQWHGDIQRASREQARISILVRELEKSGNYDDEYIEYMKGSISKNPRGISFEGINYSSKKFVEFMVTEGIRYRGGKVIDVNARNKK